MYPTKDVVEFGGISFGGKGSGYDHIYKVVPTEHFWYDNKPLVVLKPTIIGRSILKVRPLLEKVYNDNFLVSERYEDMILRQVKERARIKGLSVEAPLFAGSVANKCLMYPFVDEVALLDHDMSDFSKGYESGVVLRTLHNQDFIWGDAWLGNLNVNSKGDIYPRDFSFKPNDKLDIDFLKYKDFIGMYLSNIHRLGDEGCEGFKEGYKINKSILKNLEEDIASAPHKPEFVSDNLFFKPVFGMKDKEAFVHKYELLHRKY